MVAAQTILTAPAVLLPEVGGALARQTGRPELAIRALSLLQRLPNLRIAFIEAELALASGELAAQLRMRGADALYVALAERLGVPLVTWDRGQRERGSGRVETLTPTEALGATR
jgi:predicted nucleic acid-binding protein